jgi:hypothetical protein
MPEKKWVITWIAIGVLLAVLGFVAGFLLPFWNYSTTYAPIIG